MKCISCGAEIGLTDERCPHCGRLVTETDGYRSDLKDYTDKSKKTKRGLSKVLVGNIKIIISAVVMLVLLIAIRVAVYVKENAYSFRSDAMRKEAVRNYDEYSQTIKEYLDAGDYTGFAAFKEYHNIAEWEAPYDDMNLLWELTRDYADLVAEVESARLFGPEADRYDPEGDVNDCQRAIHEFYDEYEYRQEEIANDPYAVYIHDMKDKADIILDIWLGIDKADRDDFLESSEIEKEAYLEGVIMGE